MPGDVAETEDILTSVLRGAAKILGCASASLIVIDEERRDASLRVGTVGDSADDLDRAEAIIGQIKAASFPLEMIQESLVYAAWNDRAPLEAASLGELVGGAFDPGAIAGVDVLAGERRYICVPALSGSRCHGIMVFDKTGAAPFSSQQRELMLRYAQRVAEILDNDLRERAGAGAGAAGAGALGPARRFLVDRRGRLAGAGDGVEAGLGGAPVLTGVGTDGVAAEWLATVVARARRMLRSPARSGPGVEDLDGGDAGHGVRFRAELSRIRVQADDLVLVQVSEVRPGPGPEGHQLLQVALRESAAAVLVAPDFRITSCNAATERLFGCAAADLTDRPISVLFRDPSDARTILNHQFLSLTRGWFEEGTVLRRGDGRLFPGRVEALLLADGADEVVGFLVLIRDTSSLSDEPTGIDRLMRRERLATMGEMAAQLAHEVRNPLVAIGATIESVAGDLAVGSEARTVLSGLQGEITRMDMILKDYLSMAARHNASVSKVEIARVVDDARRLLVRSRKGAGRTITSLIPDGLTVLADPEGMRHVLFNLLLNGLEAVPSGGEVTCRASVSGRNVTIHVEDNGPGLACEPDECFEPFFTTKKHGTGLGLTVCQKVVAIHGGTLSIRTRPEGGCRVTVVLPRRGE